MGLTDACAFRHAGRQGPTGASGGVHHKSRGIGIVNALGPISASCAREVGVQRRYLVIVTDTGGRQHGPLMQVQVQK